jgi:hypothetical protein
MVEVMPKKLLRITTVKPLANFRVHVKLTDGTERVLNLRPYMRGPWFRPLAKNPKLFEAVRVEHGTLSWPTGQDLCPDTLLETDTAARVASRWIRAMSRICEFDGISIYIYTDDHGTPHVHVFHGDDEAKVNIIDGAILKGSLPRPVHKKVRAWLRARQAEVAIEYTRALAGRQPRKIPPP